MVTELINTIEKAALLFGSGRSGVDRAIAVIRQINQKGRLKHEDLLQLSNYVPGVYLTLAAHLEISPTELRERMQGGLLTAEVGITELNNAIYNRYLATPTNG
ncbi:tape measure protein [Spirosoma sp. HMF4905]|uniref:Tape measure protein n=1 Tax=Spirosoma arboris TaxID=2682092 RepID=A0A7K1S4A7_9BACT|nr:tape measure protein [Spirosoma arboris]